MVPIRIWLAVLVAGFWLVAVAGCEKTEQITRYTVEKPPPIDAPAIAEPRATDAEPTDRTLAAIVPLTGQGWFFKLAGPKDAVGENLDAFTTFLESVHFSAEGKPQWTLPEGWQEQPGSQFRHATLVIPSQGKPLEVSVTALPNPGGDEAQYVLINVNRWRGQLRLPPITKEELAGQSTLIKLDGATATMVNLLGTAAPDNMGRPPFMSGARDGN
jgi:hypothetical protein